MNSDTRSVKEHTGGCVASLPLYNPVVKHPAAWCRRCGGDVLAYIIVEANNTPQGD